MKLSAILHRKAGIGLSAGEKAAATKRATGTLYTIARKAAETKAGSGFRLTARPFTTRAYPV